MRQHARNIWDIKIQCVCGIISAREGEGAELYLSANFGQASLSPPRVVINPNRLYPIEPIIRRERKFAINILNASQREIAIRMSRVRRRALHKDRVVDIPIVKDSLHEIPYLPECQKTLFCEVEHVLETGDHTIIISRVLESRTGQLNTKPLPLLYREISGTPTKYPRLQRKMRYVFNLTGIKEKLIRALGTGAGSSLDLAAQTYQEGGQTESEINEIVQYGLQDKNRTLSPPSDVPTVLKRRIGVCVVGVGAWGSYHCMLLRQASSNIDLYVCGRDPQRVERLARAVGAKDFFIGIEKALHDDRVQAVSLVLPHDIHRISVEMAAAAGKHVLVEKPIATTLQDADAMIRFAQSVGIVFMVAENMHFRPAVREAVRAIDRGDIGEPLYLGVQVSGMVPLQGWKADIKRMGGGILMDMGVHYIRALRMLMGEPDRVFASRAMQINTKMTGEDSVQVLFSSRFGWEAHMLLNWSSPHSHIPDLIVAGEKGTLNLWPGVPYFDFYPATEPPLSKILDYVRPQFLAEKLKSFSQHRIRQTFPAHRNAEYVAEMREFVSAVVEERAPASRPLDARRDLEIVLRGYDALRQGSWVNIEPYSR